MSFKPKLLFSYAPDGNISEKLDYLEKTFRANNDEVFEILVDKKLETGNDLNAYVQQINYCFGAVLMLTPAYKEKILSKKGRLFEEFEHIMQTWENRKGDFHVYPLLIEGTWEQSVPKNIEPQDCRNLTKLQLLNGAPVKDEYFNYYITSLYKTIQHAKNNAPFEDKSFFNEREKVKQILFKEPTADFNNPDNQALIDQIIVKNNALQKVNDCESLIIKGRKGSGKSTLTQVVPHIYKNKFKGGIPVNANMLALDNIFANINVLKDSVYHISEKVNLKRKDLLKAGWKYFIHLMFIDAILLLETKTGKPYAEPEEREVLIRYFHSFYEEYDIKSLYTSKPKETRYNELTRIFFPHAITKVANFIEETQKKLKATHIDIAMWNSYFTENKFFSYCFNDQVINILRNCTRRLDYSDKKILFTLDNFDNTFYDERRNIVNSREFNPSLKQEELIKRASKDSDLLYSLIEIVHHTNKGHEGDDFVLNAFNFCITIPEDLYLDIERLYRDSYVFNNKEQTLTWTGLELMTLLHKRLEKYLGLKPGTQDTRENYFKQDKILIQLFQQHFKDIPTHVTVEFKNIEYQVPLFIYVLRHTFWRPREIIFYYADIISVHNNLKQLGLVITYKDIKTIVKKYARLIIEREYITEFGTHCVNIEDIISRFKGKTQILTYQELYDIIGNIDFLLTSQSSNADETNSLVEKLSFLYQIGFLGIVLSPEKAEAENLHKYSFMFNAGLNIFLKNRRPTEQDIKHHTYIIHPVFCEYLSLNKDKNEEFVLNFTFEYLQDQYKFFTLLYG